MASLEIRLLGGFAVLRDGRPAPGLRTQKARALLAYLALHPGRPLARELLAGLFWPEQTSARAAHSLRQALTFLRRALNVEHHASPLTITRDDVTFNLIADHEIDALTFERLLEAGETDALAGAARLYRGALLEGFFVDGAPEFETWLVAERERLQAGALSALDRLAGFHLARGDYARTKETLLRALALDPWHETAHRGLMRALALGGDPAAALAQYEKCRRALAEGLGVEPLPATQALHRQILAGELLPVAASAPGAVRPQPRFAGREAGHAQLAAALAAIHNKERPVAVFIEGEAGVGKTRLAEEFARFAASQGATVLAGRCFEFGEEMAYQPIVEALRSSPPHFHTPKLSPAWLAELSRLLPELRDLHPGLLQPQSESDEGARQRLFEAVVRFLQTVAGERRAALVFLDDLHWADPATLDLLHYAIRQCAGSGLLFLGAYRPEEAGDDHPLTTLSRGLSRQRLSETLSLKPLPLDALQSIAESLVEGGAISFADYLFRESEGNPFVLTETLNTLYEVGALQPASGEKWRVAGEAVAPVITASLRDTILSRVHRLPEPARHLLQFAAVLGRAFDVALLRGAAGPAAEAGLEAWLERRLVRPVSKTQYDFAHDKIREVVYRQLSDAKRQRLHGEVGAALERNHAANLEPVAPALAHHFGQGPDPKRALPFLLMAAQGAERMMAFASAARFCTQALEIESDDLDLRFEFLRLRQRAYEFLGQAGAEGTDAEAMLAVAETLNDSRRMTTALRRLALFQIHSGQPAKARATIERALALCRTAGETAGEIDALVMLALLVRDVEGDARQAFGLFESVRDLARSIGDQIMEATGLGNLAILLAERGEYVAAVEMYRQSIALFRVTGERSAVAGYLNPLASLYRALGQYSLAAEALTEAWQISVELEHAAIQGWTRLNLGRLALWQNRFAEARESFASALASEHRLSHIEAHAHLGLGQTLLAEKDFAAARERLARALTLFAELDAGMAILARAYLSQAHLGLGQFDEARAHSAAAIEAVESGKGTFLEVQQIYLCHVRVLRMTGQLAEASRWLAKARALVLAQAEGLSGERRESFLAAVPINREILEAWEQGGVLAPQSGFAKG
jgi:predicted ATPase/DNA-binding SARP family transcriptional activator